MEMSDEQLYKTLDELGYLQPADLQRAKQRSETEHISLYDALLSNDVLSDQDLGKIIAYSVNLPFVSLAQLTIPDDILRITPEDVAQKYQAITFGIDDKGLKIVTARPGTTDLFEMLVKKAGVSSYRLFYATTRDIEDALKLYRKQLQATFEDLLSTKISGQAEPPIAKIVDTLIEYAYSSKASDIHIEPARTVSLVRFRIDGVLHDAIRLPKTLHDQVITRIKVLARLRTDEHFSAQDGRMRFMINENEELDTRVSIVPVVTGEKAVLRLLSSHNRQFSLTDLGMSETDLAKVRKGFTRPYGMILATGPTGSGKTTTMYAILKILNTRDRNIATIEDPVEYELEGINQIQTNEKARLTFAQGLRSILRQDPNIIYVGEIRDDETADIALNSAMTGHLVLSTLHTNDAATTLPRLREMGIEAFLVASTVNVIIAQRLIRKICDSCKVSFELTQTTKGWLGEEKIAAQLTTVSPTIIAKYLGSNKSVRVYQGKGCAVCHNTGYLGRVGAFEVLEVTPKIEELIVAKAGSEAINQQAIKDGMTTMLEDGMSKVQRGITTIEEVLRATRE